MIRKIIKPQQTNFNIRIPQDYLGKEVEFIMFPVAEKAKSTAKKQAGTKSLKGIFNQYANTTKTALEDKAWKQAIIHKFNK